MADILTADPSDPTSGLEPFSPGTGTPDFGTGSDGSWWSNIQNALSGLSPSLISGLLGAVGPTAGLIGSLASGGQGPTQSGQQSGTTSGTTSGTSNSTTATTRNSSSNEQSTRSGYQNDVSSQTLDPAAQQAMDRLNAMLGNNAGAAQGAYTSGLSMLQALAQGQMAKATGGSGATGLPGPPTTPQPAAVTGFPDKLPTEYNPAIGNLVKQAFGSFVGDLGKDAIVNARNRGFSGGGDLLNSAAAPMMGQTLANVPAMEAKAYLDHVLQAYGLQSENAGRKAGAEAGALNAATNALGPGVAKYGMDVQKYGIDRNADNNQIGQLTSLLNALMGPQRDLMTGNTNLLNSAPRTTTRNTLSGDSGTRTLSGTDNSISNTSGTTTGTQSGTTTGSSSGTTTTPLGNTIGQGIANIGQGVAVGVGAQQARDQQAAFQKSLLDALAARRA